MISPRQITAAVLVSFILIGTATFAQSRSGRPVGNSSAANSTTTAHPQRAKKPKSQLPWEPLFDGKTLKGWTITKFGGQGDVAAEKGRIILGVGADMTGIHTNRKLPRINYEVELEAMRVNGSDFFCGLTFPVKKSPCSLIIGGWGGGVCGLSSIDGMDASENNTTSYRGFNKGEWYRIRLRVTETKIEAWIDGQKIVDQKTTGKKISVRQEIELSKPFGFATWQTTGALRNIRIRRLASPEKK